MQQAATLPRTSQAERARERSEDIQAVLPLYVASLMVTLTGVGAVGVTTSPTVWMPVWALLTVIGHAASLYLRWVRAPGEVLFWPIVALGTGFAIQQEIAGSRLVGMETPLLELPPDMATATIVATIGVVRCFTLVSNGTLLFSPVPAISMLALVGSTNPNAEIPLFFGLLVLGSLFITGYEYHLRRTRRRNDTNPVVFYLLNAWFITLLVLGFAVLSSLAVQPLIAQFSPFALSAVSQARALTNLTGNTQTQAPVGQGPITLSPNPVYELYAPEGGLVKTGVLTNYTGKSWTIEFPPASTEVTTDEEVQDPATEVGIRFRDYRLYVHRLAPEGKAPAGVPTRTVRQRYVTRGYPPPGIPGLGRIVQVNYPRPRINLSADGSLIGSAHSNPEQLFEVRSVLSDHPPELLRAAPRVNMAEFLEPETLALPLSVDRVVRLAQDVTRSAQNDYDRIQAIIQHIEKTCTYTLQEEPTPAGADATEYYLFQTKRGACDLASTAAAVMCRAVGIPSRIAIGFVAEEALPTGQGFMIRQEHAHMWFEAYLQGYGWVTFNPAPVTSSIHDTPLQLLWYRLSRMLAKIGGGGLDALMLILVVMVTLGLVGYRLARRLRDGLRTWQRNRRSLQGAPLAAIPGFYAQGLRLLDHRGWVRQPWMTPHEFLAWLRIEWAAYPEPLAAFETLTGCFEQAYYGGDGSDEAQVRATRAVAALRAAAPKRPKPRRRLLRTSPSAG